jgi:ubiquinone/menaquinone biosynthesis C-methylase UbiE
LGFSDEGDPVSGQTDHFGVVASEYADFRPRYPDALFDWLAAQAASHALAWDCGCGNGQASVELAKRFSRVHATDISANQIRLAEQGAGVDYVVASAERSGLPDHCADLITVAQALHWFDLPSFYEEVRRVGKPGALIAAWTYGTVQTDHQAVNSVVQHFYRDVVGPFWPPERHHVETGYRELEFPFTPIATPEFTMTQQWTLTQLLGYFRSWSATARYMTENRTDPTLALEKVLLTTWGDPQQPRKICWPLSIRAARLDDGSDLSIHVSKAASAL